MTARRAVRIGATEVALESDAPLYLLLGHPVAHSRSPAMHAAALAAARRRGRYLACDVAPPELGAAFDAIRGLGSTLAGANVTVPHKTAIVPHLDALDAVAAQAGAVNTIVVEPRAGGAARYVGHDTDVTGLEAVLARAGVGLQGARVAILGAGGMARAAAVVACRGGAGEIAVAARDPARAQALLESATREGRGRLPQLRCTAWDGVPEIAARADVLVHATTLGMHPADAAPVEAAALGAACVVVDAVYAAAPTALERAARARGLRFAGGLELLAAQGAAAFALWTGEPPPIDVMRSALGLV